MKRPVGRPPLDASTRIPSAAVHLKLSASLYDKTDRVAKQKRETLQDTIRRALRHLIENERG